MKRSFDVGANEGQSALEFRRWFPDAYLFSFEPHESTFVKLAQRAENDQRWNAENLAFGATPGEAVFHENAVSGANSILATDPESDVLFENNPHRTQAITHVTVDRLSAYCDRHSIDHIDLLNIDTQGFDLEVLKGCGAF
ncbi:MAG: FkbM family methyltransferase [Candidatus Competibacteraceae bacterium]